MAIFIGQHKTKYETDGLNYKITKPDGKVFWIPRQDIVWLIELDTIEREREQLINRERQIRSWYK